MLLSKVCHWRWRLCDDTISWDIFQETSGCCFYHYCHYFPVIGSASRLSAGQKHCFSSGWKKKAAQQPRKSRIWNLRCCWAVKNESVALMSLRGFRSHEHKLTRAVVKTNTHIYNGKVKPSEEWKHGAQVAEVYCFRLFDGSAAKTKSRNLIPPQPLPARSPLNPPLTSIITCHFIILLLCQISFPFRWLPGRTFPPPRDSGMN